MDVRYVIIVAVGGLILAAIAVQGFNMILGNVAGGMSEESGYYISDTVATAVNMMSSYPENSEYTRGLPEKEHCKIKFYDKLMTSESKVSRSWTNYTLFFTGDFSSEDPTTVNCKEDGKLVVRKAERKVSVGT